MAVRWVKREDIDKVKWNSCVHYAYNGNIFGYVWYLDFIGKSWNDDILVSAYMGKQGIKKLVRHYENEEPILTLEQWQQRGGVETFPVLKHTSHEGNEGCNLYRQAQMDENYMYFVEKGYLK
jgi:hypothetical protein